MKKILTAVLASVMLLQSAICVSAEQTIIDTSDLPGITTELSIRPKIGLFVKERSKPNIDANWVDEETIESGQTVDFKATIDMDAVRSAFELWRKKAFDNDETDARREPVIGDFTVKLIYPQGIVLPDDITKGVDDEGADMAGFSSATKDIFTEKKRELNNDGSNNELTIEYKVREGITVDTLDRYEHDSKKYFPDMQIDTTAIITPTTVAYKENGYIVSGDLEGSVTVQENNGTNYLLRQTTIYFEADEPTVKILFKEPTGGFGGGGSSNYTISFEENGGSNISNRVCSKGQVVDVSTFPVPEKEGYEFVAWYLDEGLTEKAETITMDKDIKLYAGWRAKEGPGGPVPGALNGDDHFAYIIGYPEGDVRPHGNITRAEVATIFFRLLKDDVRDGNLTYENNFTDVNEGSWYNGPISTLVKLGIVNGKNAETFAPDAYITRAEFATIAARFVEENAAVKDSFNDVTGHWAESDIYEASGLGWIKGYEDNTFRPDRNITRAEAMTMINRILARIPETPDDLLDDMIKWPDNSDEAAWFYIAVQEATNSHIYDRKDNGYEKWTEIAEVKDWAAYEK